MSKGLEIFIGIFIIILIAAAIVFFIYWRGLSNAVFVYCFKRNDDNKWARHTVFEQTNKNIFRMREAGLEWSKSNERNKKELSAYNGDIRLAAQYYDFGNDKAVILVSGMFQTSTDLYYYAQYWKGSGFNCLLTDNRATGLSEGRFYSLGLYEGKDIIEWALLLHNEHGIKQVIIHGISAGAVYGLSAICEPSCPSCVSAIICDEAYYRFEDFFHNYMVKKRYNVKVFKTVMNKIRHNTDADPATQTPSSFIENTDVPVLFLAGKQDTLINEQQTEDMFSACGTGCGNSKKELVWFENGDHGYLRLCDTGKYDGAVTDFISSYIQASETPVS